MGIQPSSEMAERRAVERLPVAAMNEHDDRACAIAGKEIDRVTRTGTVGNGTWGVPLAVGCRVFRQAREQRRMLRNPRPVIVFDFVVYISGQGSRRPCLRGFLRRGLGLGQ